MSIINDEKSIKIDFFKKEGALDNRAICEGIYIVELQHCSKLSKSPLPLYIGQSVYMVKRCGEHLWYFIKEPAYFGLTTDDLKNNNLILGFRVLESLPNSTISWRQEREKFYITDIKPLTQMPDSDRQSKEKLEIVQGKIKLFGWSEL